MGGFSQILGNMLRPTGSPAAMRASQQRMQEAQERRAAEQYDLQVHQFAMEHGWQVVGPGDTVHDTVPMHPVVMQMLQPGAYGPSSGDSQPSSNAGSPGGSSNYSTAEPSSSDSQVTPDADSSSAGSGAVPLNAGSLKNAMLDADGNPNPGATFSGPAGGPTGPSTTQALMQSMAPPPASGNLDVVRKAIPSQIVKHTDSAGDVVKYEIPDANTPAGQWRIMMAQRQQAMGLQQQTQAEEQGRLNAQNQQREQYGTPLSGDLAGKYGIDPDQKFLPAEKVQLATRYFPVVGAGVRGSATTNAAQIRADAGQYKADLDNTTKQAIADQDSMDRQSLLSHRDQWNAAMAAARNNGQGNLNARAFLANSARDMALHATLLGNISKEQQRQMLAQSVLANGPDGQPVTKDGDQFGDPWSGKTLTMNYAQRIRLGSALNQSQSTVAGYQQTAADLQSRRDQILSRFGGGTPAATSGPASPGASAPAGGGTAGPSAAPSSSVAPPIAAAPATGAPAASAAPAQPSKPRNWADAARAEVGPAGLLPGRSGTPPPSAATAARPHAKVATQAQVNTYAQRRGISAAAALKEFQTSGYTVQ